MCKDNKIIEECFDILKLDNRASKQEVELAYDVLSSDKNITKERFMLYRRAFEYLMLNVFDMQDESITENLHKEGHFTEDEQINDAVACFPEEVKESVQFVENNLGKLSEKAKLIFATQKINLPMFFKSIKKYRTNIFGFQFWTTKNMSKLIEETCLNPLQYVDICFELTENLSDIPIQDELYSFIVGLDKFFNSDKNLCKKFEYTKTRYGVMCYCILEENVAQSLCKMVSTKAEHINCYLNIAINGTDSI